VASQEAYAACLPDLRQTVRATAGKVLRSDDLAGGERDLAAGILRDHPELGNPHVVRCDWCRETRTLFRDEAEGPFRIIPHGWFCEVCDVRASSQEIKF
jgi:hypothetical protein